jgi:drug/metabolite transporter (DMT)-like permease
LNHYEFRFQYGQNFSALPFSDCTVLQAAALCRFLILMEVCMSLWIPFTLLAAFMQAMRNALQKQLSKDVPVMGVTLARFIYAGPLALLYLLGLYQWQDYAIPQFSFWFVFYVLAASAMQILATALMVVLFRLKNYAIGVGLAKSEAILAAIVGVMFFGTYISPLGWVGVFIGGVAVFLLTGATSIQSLSAKTLALGLGSGLAFALTSLWVREASLTLGLPFLPAAAWVLFFVITTQTVVLLIYLALNDKTTLVKLWQRPQLTLATSFTSCLGSLGWFTAMSLQAVAYVKTLGQVEVLFTLLISVLVLKEKLKRQDLLGLALIVLAAVLVMWA